MSQSEETSACVDWNLCPPEIYSIIFKKLEATDLTACLFVNRTWRAIIENDACRDWQKVAATTLSDQGVEMKKNSNLSWSDVVLRSWLWSNEIHRLKVELFHEYKSKEDGLPGYWPSMTIYKDKLHVFTRKHSECIDIESCSCTQLEEHCDDMYLFDESDHIRLFYDGIYKCRLIGKKSSDGTAACCPLYEATFDYEGSSPMIFLLDEDRCYVFEEDKYLKVFIWANQQWESKWVARYYGSVTLNTMAVHRKQLYLLGSQGALWTVSMEDHQFQKLIFFPVPPYFNQSNSKALLKTILNERFSYFKEKDVASIFVKGVKCATFHAGDLFLACASGQIEAWVDHLYPRLSSPGTFNRNRLCERRFDIVRVFDCIYNMSVYEGKSFSYLFVNCGHTIYQYRLTFPGLT